MRLEGRDVGGWTDRRERKEKQKGKDGILSMLCNSHLGRGDSGQGK
mgnify:CR=1 FL=1